MAKMLLPAVIPSMVRRAAVHDNEDKKYILDKKYIRFWSNLQQLQLQLEERRTESLFQKQKLYFKQWLASNENHLEDLHHNNTLNEQFNNILKLQQQLKVQQLRSTFENTIAEKRTENQPQVQLKQEPKFEPEPELEPQLNPQPEEEPTSGQVLEEYESKPVLEYELVKQSLDLQLTNLNGKPEPKFELEDEPDLLLQCNQKPIELQPILKAEYSPYEENCTRKNELCNLESSDSESENIPLPKQIKNFEKQQFKAYCEKRKIKLVKKQVFKSKRSPYAIMKPATRYSHPFADLLKASFRSLLKKSQCNSTPPSTNSEADKCLYYLSEDEEDDYMTRCAKKAEKINKENTEYLKKDENIEESDPSIDSFDEELIESRFALKEEQVSFRHDQINVSDVVAHLSVETSPSLLEASLSSRTSMSSLEASPSPSEASISSLEASSSSIASKSPSKNEVSERITRRKHEEMQQQIANNIKKNTLNDHCYHQTPETIQIFKQCDLSTEESEDEDGDETIIDVVSVKSARKQVSFAKPVSHFEYLECQRNVQITDSDESESLEPFVQRRPRGRPPGSTKRKTNRSGPAPKRARIQNNTQSDGLSYQYQNSMRQCTLQRDPFEDVEKRRLHNDMERQRRVNMRESYEQLRRHVPAVAHSDRASKVSILKQGTLYINSLTEIGNTLRLKAMNLRQQNEMLKRKLQARLEAVGKSSYFP